MYFVSNRLNVKWQIQKPKTINHENTKGRNVVKRKPSFDIRYSLFNIRYLPAVIVAGSFFPVHWLLFTFSYDIGILFDILALSNKNCKVKQI